MNPDRLKSFLDRGLAAQKAVDQVAHPRDILKAQLGPGIWEDLEGNVHYSIPDLLAAFKLKDTPDNQDQVKAMLRDLFKDKLALGQLIERNRPPL